MLYKEYFVSLYLKSHTGNFKFGNAVMGINLFRKFDHEYIQRMYKLALFENKAEYVDAILINFKFLGFRIGIPKTDKIWIDQIIDNR